VGRGAWGVGRGAWGAGSGERGAGSGEHMRVGDWLHLCPWGPKTHCRLTITIGGNDHSALGLILGLDAHPINRHDAVTTASMLGRILHGGPQIVRFDGNCRMASRAWVGIALRRWVWFQSLSRSHAFSLIARVMVLFWRRQQQPLFSHDIA
jgi:hypothetical protein